MAKRWLSLIFEWVRPLGVGFLLSTAYSSPTVFGTDAVAQFHIVAPLMVMLMSGTVAFELLVMSFVLGEAGALKLGYQPDRAFQIQSGLGLASTAVTALLVFIFNWGLYADLTITTAMLLFFVFSAVNHTVSAIVGRNRSVVNLMRPMLTFALVGGIVPLMANALNH